MVIKEVYTKDQIAKLGNTLIFLAERMPSVSKTKALKLVYLIEEFSIRKFGVPFFDLKFDVWKLGPVSRDLFAELSSETVLLSDYIYTEGTDSATFVKSKKDFCDDEFNDLEIELLEQVAEKFKSSSAADLVQLTHRKHSPWFITAQANGILEHLELGLINTTDIEIDLSIVLDDEPEKKSFYLSHQEFLTQSRSLKF